MLRNRIAEMFRIKYPIIQAPMAGGITTAELVSAVSNSGGLGMIGAGYMTPESLRKSISEVRERTELNFGVNVFVPSTYEITEEKIELSKQAMVPVYESLSLDPNGMIEMPTFNCAIQSYEDQLQVIIDEQIPICSFTFGIPSKEIIQKLKDEGIVLIGTATTVEEAIEIEASGIDVVVAQGSEAGGHRGSFLKDTNNSLIGLMSLIPQVSDAVNIPVIAAGGIMDSRGFMASMFLGAKAVQMGTAFLTCEESGAHPLHKEAILQSKEDEIILTRSFSGKKARGINNQFIRHMAERESELPEYPIQHYLTSMIRKTASMEQNKEFMSLWSGQSPRLARKQTVEELIHRIMEGVY